MSKLTALLIGSAGQLGTELRKVLPRLGHVVPVDRGSIDLAEPESIRAVLRGCRPDVVINAAAFTDVDEAESQKTLAMSVNGVAPGIIAEEARNAGALMIHYSTDYVFDGCKPGAYEESDPVHPLNVYGSTKAAGEGAILQSGAAAIIFRIAWLYSSHHRNFLMTMMRLIRSQTEVKVVNDQHGSPTSAADVADATRAAIEWIQRQRGGHVANLAEAASGHQGIYHLSSGGSTTWYEFAHEILDRSEGITSNPRLIPVTSEEFGAPARRPANSRLNNRKVRETMGIQLSDWRIGLARVMREMVHG